MSLRLLYIEIFSILSHLLYTIIIMLFQRIRYFNLILILGLMCTNIRIIGQIFDASECKDSFIFIVSLHIIVIA